MISSIDLTSRASSITCWASRTVIPSASSAAIIGGSTMSTPSGMSSTPSALRISQISRAARRNSPASGATAPRSPTMPAWMFSWASHGQLSRWCLAADPKSQMCGVPPRVWRA